MWNDLLAPHLLAWPGVAIQEIEPWNDRGETSRRLAVAFPASIHTHSREQVFYIDARSRILCHDYTAKPFSALAKAAHYCDDHRDFSGLLFATRRRFIRAARTTWDPRRSSGSTSTRSSPFGIRRRNPAVSGGSRTAGLSCLHR